MMDGALVSTPDGIGFGGGVPRPIDELEWDVLEGSAAKIAAVSDEWDALCGRQPDVTEFLRPALIRAYLESFSPRSPLALILGRRNRDLEVVLPLTRRTVGRGHYGLQWLHVAGNIHFPVFDAICDQQGALDHADGLWKALRSLPEWDVLQLDSVPEGGVLDRVKTLAEGSGVSAYIHRPENTPVYQIRPAGSVDDVVAQQRRKLRQQLRRNLRRIRELGEVELIEAGAENDQGDPSECFGCFMEMEHRSWKGRQGTSVKAKAATRSYYERLFRDPALRGRFRVHLLELNGEPIASSIGMVSGSTFYGLKNAHSEAHRTYSPGHLLMLHMVYALGQQGFRHFDLGGEANQYKLAWTSETRRQATVFLFRPGVRGFLARALLLEIGYRVKRLLGDRPLPPVVRRFVD